MLALDGVVSGDVERGVRFREATRVDVRDAEARARTVQFRVLRWFARRGFLDSTTAADMRTWRGTGGCFASSMLSVFDGSVDGSVRIEAEDRAGFERLVRYCARGPLALERLHAPAGIGTLSSPEARMVYRLTEPDMHGCEVLRLTPIELLDRLARLVPPPRIHRHRYHGVLAPNARLRATVVSIGRPESDDVPRDMGPPPAPDHPSDNATFAEADLSGLSEEEVQAVLQYHVIAGDAPISSAALVGLLEENDGEISVETAQGEELTIAMVDGDIVFNDGQATLNMALLDMDGSNGVLHVIQGLLLPPSLTDDDPDQVTRTFTLQADGTSAWIIDGNGDNPEISLEVGGRYTFDVNEVNSGLHPLAFLDSDGTALLSQANGGSGSFADDAGVDFSSSDDEVVFTLTVDLAAALDRYTCTAHGTMTGTVSIAD